MKLSSRVLWIVGLSLGLVGAACGSAEDSNLDVSSPGGPTVVVTTSILGDVVANLVGDHFEVVTIMRVGVDPHDFQASAQQVAQIGEADALIANGAGFEGGLVDVVEAAESDGIPTFEAMTAVDPIGVADTEGGGGEHTEGGGDEHTEGGGDEHSHEGADPHFWTDPTQMATVAEAIVQFLVDTHDEVDEAALRAGADSYIAELKALDAEVVEILSVVDDEDRVLITNHDSFGYFAHRYGFEIAGTVIPSGTTADGTSAQALADLVEVIGRQGVSAVFAETTSAGDLAQTLATEAGGEVQVVELYTGSLGEAGSAADTYLKMVWVNAELMAEALAN